MLYSIQGSVIRQDDLGTFDEVHRVDNPLAAVHEQACYLLEPIMMTVTVKE